jgi:hypothetical protein
MSNLELSFHEALAKAFAAHAPEVRLAYFDLASFYREKLGRRFRSQAPGDMLRQCLSATGHA